MKLGNVLENLLTFISVDVSFIELEPEVLH